jgi:hypothetical protein
MLENGGSLAQNIGAEQSEPPAARHPSGCDMLENNKTDSEIIKIDDAAQYMMTLPQANCPVIHRFGPGLYIREVLIPAGSYAIGHYQKFDHFNVLLKGRVTMLNDDGSAVELVAPMAFTGRPGRKIGYVHEDMVWQNIYSTTETDVETLESMLLDKSKEFVSFSESKMSIEKINHEADREDYKKCLDEYGFTEETARSQSEMEHDRIDLPYGAWKIKVGDSAIEGKGLFATADINEGDLIANARVKGCRTIAGRYTNHSKNPNSVMVKRMNGDIDLVALRNINGCQGGLNGEEITINYRDALSLSGLKAINNG